MTERNDEELAAYLEMREAFKMYGEPVTVNGVPYRKYVMDMEKRVRGKNKRAKEGR